MWHGLARWIGGGGAAVALVATGLVGSASSGAAAGSGAERFGPGTHSVMVPAGVTVATVTVDGAEGGAAEGAFPRLSSGARVTATLPVVGCTHLTVDAGNAGNGGAPGGSAGGGGGGGGAASDIIDANQRLLVIAGGGGGSGNAVHLGTGRPGGSGYFPPYTTFTTPEGTGLIGGSGFGSGDPSYDGGAGQGGAGVSGGQGGGGGYGIHPIDRGSDGSRGVEKDGG